MRRLIGEAFSDDAFHQLIGAGCVSNTKRNTVIEAKIELGKIAVQVLLRTVLISALHSAFKYGKVSFNAVSGHVTSHVFFGPVFHGFMLGKCQAAML